AGPSWRHIACIYIALAAGTMVAFWEIGRNEFVDFDDGPMIVDNVNIRNGFTLDGIQYAFTEPHLGNWQPLTSLSHMLDCQLFGVERPGLHHLISLGLHVLSALLLCEALRRMTGDLWPSALVAALFAVHPLRVESVAWAAERKDVLSGFFAMLMLLSYVGYSRRPGVRRYLVVCIAFVLGLISKPMLVTFPFVLLLLDWWPLRRCSFMAPVASIAHKAGEIFPAQRTSWVLLEKLPLLAAAMVVGCLTILVQGAAGADTSLEALPLKWRMVNAVLAYVMYLWKTVWPTKLAVLYPHPGMVSTAEWGDWLYPAIAATLLLISVSYCAVRYGKRYPYILVGWLWYLGMLVPVIGLIQVGVQAYADRYTYLPLIGVYLIIAWGARDVIAQWPRAKYTVAALGTSWLIVIIVLTRIQVGYWHDSKSLFEHTLSVTSNNYTVHNNLGNVLSRLGKDELAIKHFQEAVRLKGDYAEAHNNLGNVLDKLGRTQEAVTHYQVAVRFKADFAEVHSNLAVGSAAFQPQLRRGA
ncbi:MAG: tetratricopeptide repeat protein, partial [Planctomycetales bacterium]|nr:tetratricopeptide repeat protein [Planctomycetales bacterium]